MAKEIEAIEKTEGKVITLELVWTSSVCDSEVNCFYNLIKTQI